MHQLRVGHKCTLIVKHGLSIVRWMYGTNEQLLAKGGDPPNVMRAEGHPICGTGFGLDKFFASRSSCGYDDTAWGSKFDWIEVQDCRVGCLKWYQS